MFAAETLVAPDLPHARMRQPLAVSFRRAAINDPFTSTYLSDILLPGVRDPNDANSLYASDAERLVGAGAIVALGEADDEPVAGLHMTVDEEGIVWVRGVRVVESMRGFGHGSRIVRKACRFARDVLGRRRAALTVRCDASGQPREAACRTYERCGFRLVKIFAVLLLGSPYDRHIGPAGAHFFTARMEREL